MRPVWKWIGGVAGALVVAVVLVVALFNWNWLRGPLESRLSAATGKDVTIAGPITGEYAWTPTITLSDIKILAPDWKPDPQVARIDKIEFQIELKKLLGGTVSIPTLRIEKPVAKLERRGDEANWDIAAEASGPSSRRSFPLLGDIVVTNGAVSYRDPAKHLSLDGTVASLKGNGGPGGGPFKLDGKGTYQKAPFTLKLTGDSLLHMRGGNDPYKVDVTADIGNTHVVAGGTIADPVKMTGLALGMQIRGDNAEDLYAFFGIPAPTTPPYKLSGTLDRPKAAVWTFHDFGGTVGVSDLNGALTFDLSKKRLFISGVLQSNVLRLSDLGVVVGAPTKPSAQAPVNADQKKVAADFAQSDRLLPDAPLQVDAVRNVDMDISFKAAKVQAEDLPMDRIDMHLKTDGGVMTLDPLQIGLAGGLLRGTVAIDARGDAVKSDSDIRFSEFKIERFFAPTADKTPTVTGEIEGRLRFTGTGDSLRRALGTADGTASFVVAKGTISKWASALLGLDVAKALGVLISGDKKIELNCFVSDFAIKKGVMTPRTLVIDTDTALITGKGMISLTDEKFDMEIKGQSKKPTLSLRGPIHATGTFRHPDTGLGSEAYARLGGSALLGALLTPVAAIITFIDSGKDHDADCGGLEAKTQANAAKQAPVDTTPPPAVRSGGGRAARPAQSAPKAAPAPAK